MAKLLLSNDESGGLALLLQLLERADTGIDKTIMMALVARLRARQYTSILTSYDAITLPTAAAMLQLSAEECKNGKFRYFIVTQLRCYCVRLCEMYKVNIYLTKIPMLSMVFIILIYSICGLMCPTMHIITELLARGCISNNDEADTLRPGIMGKPAALNDGSLLQTLTQCVAELERQPLSIDMKKEIEQAQLQVVVEREEMMAMET